jgi:RimJ/RimL family protein N-acetyltransferase
MVIQVALKLLTISDVTEEYVSWLHDKETTRYLEVRHEPPTLALQRQYVSKLIESNDNMIYGIFVENNRHVGVIKLSKVSNVHHSAELSLLLGSKLDRGVGIGKKSIQLIEEEARRLELVKLNAGCYKVNIASTRLFQSSEFKIEGILESQVVLDNGLRGKVFRFGKII